MIYFHPLYLGEFRGRSSYHPNGSTICFCSPRWSPAAVVQFLAVIGAATARIFLPLGHVHANLMTSLLDLSGFFVASRITPVIVHGDIAAALCIVQVSIIITAVVKSLPRHM